MKKKSLAINILLALSATAFMPMGIWAAESTANWQEDPNDATKLNIETNKVVHQDDTFDGKSLSDYQTVVINYTPTGSAGENRALGVYSARYDVPDTKFIIYVNESAGKNNNDALHLTNHFAGLTVGGLEAYVKTTSSDVFNISRDCTTDASVTVLGDLKAVVEDGNGIRANASVNNKDATASIIVG